jgi:hypothetical protein
VAPSDTVGDRARSRGRSLVRALLLALLAVAVLVIAWEAVVFLSVRDHFRSGFDDRRFDRLEADFDRDRAAFVAAGSRMRELVAAHPDAVRIGWSLMLICDREQARPADACERTGAADQAAFRALPNVDVVVHQAKDDGKVFLRFYGNDPPRYTIMSAPGDTDADDRGFRSHRALESGWTMLGPIPDEDRESEQWAG